MLKLRQIKALFFNSHALYFFYTKIKDSLNIMHENAVKADIFILIIEKRFINDNNFMRLCLNCQIDNVVFASSLIIK